VAELKAHLSEYLAAARRGEDVIVTDRGGPVARITRITSTSASQHPHWAELLRAGLMRPPAGKLPAGFRKLKRPRDPDGAVGDALRAEREEGW
jgi:prevent-host-death family protein